LDLVDELKDQDGIQLASCHWRIANYYNTHVRNRPLPLSDLVLKKYVITSAFRKEGKLWPNWEGPYRIQEMLALDTCILQMLQGEILGKTWNITHLEKYFTT